MSSESDDSEASSGSDESSNSGSGDSLDLMRAFERDHIKSLDTTKKVGQWFIIESAWLARWREFVNGEERPGRIDNRRLVEAGAGGIYCPRRGLKKADDYRAVNHKVWAFFMSQYGGGPTLVRPKVDIYSKEIWHAAPKTEAEQALIEAALEQPSCALPEMVNDAEIRQQVIDALVPEAFEEGAELMRQGQLDADFAIVASGACVMEVAQQKGKKFFSRNQPPMEVPLAEGDHFGHMLRDADGEFEAAQTNIRATAGGRLWKLSQEVFGEIEALYKKRVQDRMCDFLKANAALLKHAEPHVMEGIAAELEQKLYSCDAVVSPHAGQKYFYFVMEGEFAVIGEKSSNNREQGSPRKVGDYFGESSLRYPGHAPNYRFRANVDSKVCQITAEALERALGGAQQLKELPLRTFDKRGVEVSGPTAKPSSARAARRVGAGGGVNGERRSLVGLKNLGNTCYMNSCVQCLSHTEDLRVKLLAARDGKEINQASRYKGKVAFAMTELVKNLHRGPPKSACVPRELKREMGHVHRMFAGFAQQDSQEFLRYLLDALEEDTNRVRGKLRWEELKDIDRESDENKAARYWEYHASRNNSPITDLFTGQLMSVLKCQACSHRSASFDPVMDLSVPLVKANGRGALRTLTDCLDEFVAEELLQKMEAVYCSRCKDHQNHTKALSVARLPKILVVHLKRFEPRRKITARVAFDPDADLDLSSKATALSFFCAFSRHLIRVVVGGQDT